MKTVPSVYNIVINTIFLSHRIQVDEGSVFSKHTIARYKKYKMLKTYQAKKRMVIVKHRENNYMLLLPLISILYVC